MPPRPASWASAFARCSAGATLFEVGCGAVALRSADSQHCRHAPVEAARLLPVPRDCVVIGPSFDGGYYLIGIRRAHAELFGKIDWSTAQSRRRALGLGLEVLDLDA